MPSLPLTLSLSFRRITLLSPYHSPLAESEIAEGMTVALGGAPAVQQLCMEDVGALP
jgi:hypothetical protein